MSAQILFWHTVSDIILRHFSLISFTSPGKDRRGLLYCISSRLHSSSTIPSRSRLDVPVLIKAKKHTYSLQALVDPLCMQKSWFGYFWFIGWFYSSIKLNCHSTLKRISSRSLIQIMFQNIAKSMESSVCAIYFSVKFPAHLKSSEV